MKCETIRSMISSYIDRDLNEVEKLEFEKHLSECEQCREEYETMLDIIAACGNLEEIELPKDFRTELHQKLLEEKKRTNIFSSIMGRKGMKMASGLVAAVLVVAIGIGIMGNPGLLKNKTDMSTAPDIAAAPNYGAAEAPAAPPSLTDTSFSLKRSEEKKKVGAAAEQPQITSAEIEGAARNSIGVQFNESLDAGSGAANYSLMGSKSERMVIRTGNISVNVTSVDKATAEIRMLTENSGGYVENSQVEIVTIPQVQESDNSGTLKETAEKYANMTLRVPENKFESIFDSVKGMGKLVSENMNGSDITSEYMDTTARVENLKVQEQSLKQLMTKAKNVDEILRIESELNRVRTEIDISSGDLKRWEDLVQLSTINIYLKELKPDELKSVDVPGTWGKAYRGFIKAVNNILTGLEKTLIFLVAAIPYLLVAGVLALIGLFIAKRFIIKKKQ